MDLHSNINWDSSSNRNLYNMIYLYVLVNLIVLIIAKGEINKKQFENGKNISHPIQWAIVGVLSSPAIYWLGHAAGKWYGYPIAAVVCMAFFWLFFDLYLNKRRKKPLAYAGEITKNSAWWDKQLIKLAPFWRIVVKVVILAISIGVYMLTLLNERQDVAHILYLNRDWNCCGIV